ncbi:MAG: trigger factor [Pseudomonadales bacterium]|jgi:trigger factor|tara:strand:- start:81 stop:1508 length:1428 start_codon:yes stop_codon:yes gene_type:complete
MQVTVETVSKLERKMRITVPASEVSEKVEVKIKEAASQVRIKGFRPGKVPIREVRRRFGPGILQEVSSEIMQQSFAAAVDQQSLKPAGMPEIKDVVMELDKDLTFSALIEIFPEIKLGAFGDIKVTKPVADVSPDDLELMIEKLRDQRKSFVVVDRAAALDDQVTIDFAGTVDGEAFDGGQGDDNKLILGSNTMIPGFEDGIVGLTAGKEQDITVTFPDDYQAEDLAGKQAVFAVKVHEVAESTLPELNEDFFKEFGVEDGGMAAFRVEVQNNMEKELKAAVENRVKTQVMDGLILVTPVDSPKALVNDECQRMRQEMVQQFGGGQQFDVNMLPLELFTDQAERRVKLGLIVNAIVEQNNVVSDEARVRTKIEEIASSYEQPEQLINYYYSNEQQLSQVQSLVLEEQIVSLILDSADIEETRVSYEEALKPAEPEVAEPEVAEAEVAEAEVAEAEEEAAVSAAEVLDDASADDKA